MFLEVSRFAPSPTGFLHIGNFRTSFYSLLFVNKYNGVFILRVDDTDKIRVFYNYIDSIILNLSLVGFNFSFVPFYQSTRFFYYNNLLLFLFKNGFVYKCYCSKYRLFKLRFLNLNSNNKSKYDCNCKFLQSLCLFGPFVLRFDLSIVYGNGIHFFDKNKGRVCVSLEELDDFIISRSVLNGFTYNFSSIVDDIDMSVSFVLRGEDHVTNTFKQFLFLLLYSVGSESFVHLPLILDYTFQNKLSKRNFSSSLYFYRDNSFFLETLVNYFFSLGWSFSFVNYDFFYINDMINVFNIKFFNKKNSYLNTRKMLWVNRHYLNVVVLSFFYGYKYFYFFYYTRVYSLLDFNFYVYRLVFNNFYLVFGIFSIFNCFFYYSLVYYFFLELKYFDQIWSSKVLFLILNNLSLVFNVNISFLYKFFRFLCLGQKNSIPIVFVLCKIGLPVLFFRVRFFLLLFNSFY